VSSQPNAQNLRLADGRPVSIDAIHVEEPLSAAGIVYTNSTQRAFHEVASHPTTTMPGWREMPILVVPPVPCVATLWCCRAGNPIIDLIARQLASLDETTWRMNAQDWEL
jgi:hypothetical protein